MTGEDAKPHLTVLVGAGLSQALGLPGVADIDQHLLGLTHPWISLPLGPAAVPIIPLLRRALLSFYDEVNFELLLHSAELIFSISVAGSSYSIGDVNKPPFLAFMDVSPRWRELVEGLHTSGAAEDIVQNVASYVHEADKALAANRLETVKVFLTSICSLFDLRVFTLNYDRVLERSSSGWFDGFVTRGNAIVFDGHEFLKEYRRKSKVLCHLHGSIDYRIDASGDYQVVKLPSGTLGEWPPIRAFRSRLQSGEHALIGPIISGLRKADKAAFAPFGHYYNAFVESVVTEPRLLIIGYGFKDYLY